MKICELMKNHIKNYIKIPRPATVPFGTEAEVTTIRAAKEKVTGRYKDDCFCYLERERKKRVVEIGKNSTTV